MKVHFEATGENADDLVENARRTAARFAGDRRWVIQSIRVTVRGENRSGGFGGTGWVKAWVESD